jgi:glycosyltransferase involved in cell wall biosynthesis
MIQDLPLVSIVIATRNEEGNIANCLNSILRQEYPNIEIVVIDNDSSDKTVEISKFYTPNVYQFGPERSAQRNYGLLFKSKGVFGMFIDADMILSQSLVGDCVKHLVTSREICGIYVPEIILGRRLFHKVRRFERPYYSATTIDCVRFFSIRAFREIGGFDEKTFVSGSGEDWDLDRRLRKFGATLSLSPKFQTEDRLNSIDSVQDALRYQGVLPCIFHNEERVTFFSTMRKKIYYSSAFSKYVSKWGKNDKEIRQQLSPTYRLFKLFFESGVKIRTLKHLNLYLLFLLYKFCIAAGIILSTVVPRVIRKNATEKIR